MAKRCLLTIARQELTRALHAPVGRSERVLLGAAGRSRLSVLAFRADSAGAAVPLDMPWTVQVIAGRVRLRYDGVAAVGFPGDLLVGPAGGTLTAEEDCAVLLTLDPVVGASAPTRNAS